VPLPVYGRTSMKCMPAARAALMPSSLSSYTTQRAGSACKAAAAFRKMSGAGLPRSTSSRVTTASNQSRNARWRRVLRMISQGPVGGVTGVYALGEEGDLAQEPVQRREGAV
jgi:hypothetical protein